MVKKAPSAVVIYYDNQGAIALAKNPSDHSRTKHIDIQQHFVREKVAKEVIQLKYIPTGDMVTNGLTKPLARDPFVRFRDALGLKRVLSAGTWWNRPRLGTSGAGINGRDPMLISKG